MYRVEIYLRSGAAVEIECKGFVTHQAGPLHKADAIDFVYLEDAKPQVLYIDFKEMVA